MSLLERIQARWRQVAEDLPQERSADKILTTLLGLLGAFGRRTVTGSLVYLGLSQQDWSGRYRHFSRSPWTQDAIFRVACTDAAALVPAELPFIPISLDDTSLPTTGTLGGLASWQRDPRSPPFQVNLRRGLRFVHAALVVPQYAPGVRPMAISTACDFCPPVKKPGAKASDEDRAAYRKAKAQKNLSIQAVATLARHRQWFDQDGLTQRTLLTVVDGSYTNRTVIAGLPERSHLIGRCRKDIVLYQPGPTARRYGKRFCTPEGLRTDTAVAWTTTTCHYAGANRDIDYKVTTELRWRATGTQRPVRVIVLRPIPYAGPGGRRGYRQPAFLLTTDLTTPVNLLIQAYLDRWQIEVLHRDLKDESHLGEAQVRNPNSVGKLHASVVAINALTQLAAYDHCRRQRPEELPPLPCWRRHMRRRNTSQQEIITLLRSEMAQAGITPAAAANQALPIRESLAQAG